MDLRDYLRLTRRNWFILIAATTVGVAAAAVYTSTQVPQYSATSKAFVSTEAASSATDLSQSSTYTQQIVSSYADVATTPYVLETVIRELNLQDSPTTLARRVTASAPSDTVVLEINARDSSPLLASRIANAVTNELAARVPSLVPESQSATGTVKITQIQEAAVAKVPDSPRLGLNLALGALAGLVLALALALLRENLDNRVRNPHDLEQMSSAPILGAIRFDPDATTHPLVVQQRKNSPRAEAFRTLRTNLQFLPFDGSSRVLVITSSIQGEGKSTTASNLAISIADAGKRVLLVDADLRRPSVAVQLGIDGSTGLTDVLIGNADFDDAQQVWGDNGLHVLPAGQVPPNPNELIQSNAMLKLIEAARESFDVILFDAPPLLPVSDAAILARSSDGAVVIAAAGVVRRAQLQQSLSNLTHVGARVLGIVLSKVPKSSASSPYGYDYSSYGYSSDMGKP